MKKLLSLALTVAFAVALGASVGCEDSKTTGGPSNKTPTGGASPTGAKSPS